MKDAETRVREQHDYRFVLQYFSASRDLHRTLVGNVTFLANEVEQLRANVDHSSESISIMEKQFVELEVGCFSRLRTKKDALPLQSQWERDPVVEGFRYLLRKTQLQ